VNGHLRSRTPWRPVTPIAPARQTIWRCRTSTTPTIAAPADSSSAPGPQHERCLGASHSATATEVYNLALVATRTGDEDEAERLLNGALRLWSSSLGNEHPFVIRARDALADFGSEARAVAACSGHAPPGAGCPSPRARCEPSGRGANAAHARQR
jgi:hypothetical protein